MGRPLLWLGGGLSPPHREKQWLPPPEGELPYLFDSFWRGSNAADQPGSGLGLAICRQLMAKMDGELFAQAGEEEMAFTAVFRKPGG